MARSKEFINSQIIKHYPTENSDKLASRLGITTNHLRVKARRLGVRKIRVNEIIDGRKRCPHCGLMKDIECFSLDKYQANSYDYYCKSCRNIKRFSDGKKDNRDNNDDSLAFHKGKKQNDIIVINGKEYLKCKNCRVIQPLSEYSIDNKMSHGHRNTCKTCEMLKRRGII